MKRENMNILLSSMQNAWSHFADEKSKIIFEKRLMYSITRDNHYTCVSEDMQKRFQSFIFRLKEIEMRLIVRGAGDTYQFFKHLFPDVDFVFLCSKDASTKKRLIDGKYLYPPYYTRNIQIIMFLLPVMIMKMKYIRNY